jgi:small subunit ribosomal protein S8
MSVNDPIADALARIRNAALVHKSTVTVYGSRVVQALAQILKDEGYIADVEPVQEGARRLLRITIKYAGGRKPVITQLRRVSRPGRRVYTKRDDIPWVLSGAGIAILSTPRGIMTGTQARRLGVGGEVLCYVW